MPLSLLFPIPVSPAVKAEQIRQLYRLGPTVQLLGIVSALVVVSIFWRIIDPHILLAWFCSLLLLTTLRIHSIRRFLRTSPAEPEIIRHWGRRYVVGALLSGLAWAALGAMYRPDWPLAAQISLFAIFLGVTAGACNADSSHFPAFPAFYLPPIIMLASRALLHSNGGFFQLGLVLLIYPLLLYFSGLQFYNRLATALEMRFENERLVRELGESNRKLKYLADIDELTGIANRRAMDRCLQAECNRHRRNRQTLSLLFIDVDYFKQYNDTYGHDGGDQCLIQVADLLRSHAQRAGEMVARFGGEEFAVILPETSAEQALQIAEAIRQDVELLAIPHASSQIAAVLTVSIGVCTRIPTEDEALEKLRQAADKALYQAKNAGRNRIVKA